MILIKEGDSGSLVEMVQIALIRAGYLNGRADGLFGGQTKQAVREFQSASNLVPDGIVGIRTLEKLRTYLVGYTLHTIKQGDTLYSIASMHNTTVPLIENANPNLSADNLRIGMRIIVPLNFSLVPTNISYNALLTEFISEGLAVRYPFIDVSIVGRSVMGKPLILLKMGKGDKKVFANATHHANEWITTPLLLKFVEEYAKGVVTGDSGNNESFEELFNKTTFYIMPMVDPDGVDLVTGALSKESEAYYDALTIANNYPEIPFPSGWKANIVGIDLNLNYPAMWEEAREQKYAAGFTRPAPRDFVGFSPLDASESKAVYNLSLREDFDLTVSLHTQGEEIYWRFADYNVQNGGEIGEKMAAASGYKLAEPSLFASFAGYKDWFIMTYQRPGYTVEAGLGRNPLPISQFDRIYPAIKAILKVALEEV